MIYRATRVSRSEGFRWDAGTPLDYQHASDTLMGCQISDRPYYVICGHAPLRVTISAGQRVDSRENRLYSAEELEWKPDAAGGAMLLAALLSGANGQGTVVYPDQERFEQALCYAAAHLPRSRTGHIIISENVPEFGTTVLLVFRRDAHIRPAYEWIAALPEFAAPAKGIAAPNADGAYPSFDAVYDAIVHANSQNHDLRILTFLAFACGAEPDPRSFADYAKYMQAFQPDEALIRSFFTAVPDQEFDVPTMLPVLYGLSGTQGDRILAACVRSNLTTEQLKAVEAAAPPPKIGNIVSSFARAYELGYEKFSLEKASIAELFELYQYISDSRIPSADLRHTLSHDENSVSMVELIAAAEQQEKHPGDAKTKVHGVMPAVLYWYDVCNKEECAALYGNPQTAAKMMAQVKMLALPKRMQKLEFRDDFYQQEAPKTRLRDVQNLPRLLLAGLLAVLALLVVGGVLGGALTYGKMQHTDTPPAAQTTQTTSPVNSTGTALSSDSALLTGTTQTVSAVTIPQESAGLRTQDCRMDAESQADAEAFLTGNADLPAGWDLARGITYCNITSADLAAFSAENQPAARYMIPYQNADGCGIICLMRQDDGSLGLSQIVPGQDADTMPAVWFDLLRIERDLNNRTAEPSAVILLMCADGPYRKLVYSDLGGQGYVMPYLFSADSAGGLLPLQDGASYPLQDYLKWLGYSG